MVNKNEKIFAQGLIFKAPRPKAPDFIKGTLSVKVDEFKEFIDKYINKGWVNIDLKVSKGGKYYAELNTWKKKETQAETIEKNNEIQENTDSLEEKEINIEDIPFDDE